MPAVARPSARSRKGLLGRLIAVVGSGAVHQDDGWEGLLAGFGAGGEGESAESSQGALPTMSSRSVLLQLSLPLGASVLRWEVQPLVSPMLGAAGYRTS